MQRVIHLHVDAPAKPAFGRPCNGCGVCCACEPCPLGIVLSRRTQGACAALQWSDGGRLYRCGVVVEPARFLPRGLRWFAPALGRWAKRSISAGRGCDANVSALPT